jgi:hypothetical protein
MRSSIFCTVTRYYHGDQIKEDEMGGVALMGRREMRTEFWLENLKVRDHSEELGVGGG